MRLFFIIVSPLIFSYCAAAKPVLVNEALVANYHDDMQKCVAYANSHEQAKECTDAIEAKYAPTFADAGVK